MKIDIQHFKDLLTKEAEVLETQLSSIGRINPSNAADWEAVEGEVDTNNADDADLADDLEQFENNKAELNQLEIQLNNVKSALKKIEEGKYGICEISGEEIELDRLEANPSARTCKKHMNN